MFDPAGHISRTSTVHRHAFGDSCIPPGALPRPMTHVGKRADRRRLRSGSGAMAGRWSTSPARGDLSGLVTYPRLQGPCLRRAMRRSGVRVPRLFSGDQLQDRHRPRRSRATSRPFPPRPRQAPNGATIVASVVDTADLRLIRTLFETCGHDGCRAMTGVELVIDQHPGRPASGTRWPASLKPYRAAGAVAAGHRCLMVDGDSCVPEDIVAHHPPPSSAIPNRRRADDG